MNVVVMDIELANVLEFGMQGEDLESKPWRELPPPLLGWGRLSLVRLISVVTILLNILSGTLLE